MSRLLVITLSVVLLISMSVAAFAEDRTVVVKPVKSTIATPITLGPAGPALDCQVGNLNAPAVAIGGFIAAPETYKLAFDPGAACSVCPVGMNVTSISIYLQTETACDIVMGVDLEEAAYPGDPTCPNPGPVVCTSPLYNVALPSAGLWVISLPIDCACVPVDRMYLLGVNFQSVSCAIVPDLITDGGPATACANWNDFGRPVGPDCQHY